MARSKHAHSDFVWPNRGELVRHAEDDDLWKQYLRTKVHIDSPAGGGTVWPAESGEVLPPLGPLHVITAVQPDSVPTSDENAARLSVLDHELDTESVHFMHAVGLSLDDDYHETSRAVFGLTDARARDIGGRFGQVAIFAWHGRRWSLFACATDRQTHRGWRWIQDGSAR
ncbi:DUF3293 domain-containing protein [Gordonia sp. NPDC062954]|uniref:DUF3293 domain-containing protein n=1 Tax=Gordonia sp. NPDC062954 TaxID=3364003 RepID=UPI0037C51921